MSYDPHDYIADSRRLGAGLGLAGAVVVGLLVISCPTTSVGTDLTDNISGIQLARPTLASEGQGRPPMPETAMWAPGCQES